MIHTVAFALATFAAGPYAEARATRNNRVHHMTRRAPLLLVLAVALLALPAARAHAYERPFATGLMDFDAFAQDLGYVRAKGAGARYVRFPISWASIAPARKPRGFDATDPFDPAYHWGYLDALVRRTAAHGLVPIVGPLGPPAFARGQYVQERPNPTEFGRFGMALARRYSGRYSGLPRVRYWMVWNEPNLSTFIYPQHVNGRDTSPAIYHDLVQNFSAGVKSVFFDNKVIAGGLAPFGKAGIDAIGPLRFMKEVLCVDTRNAPRNNCRHPLRFDIWSTHPYTSGGPNHHAYDPDDVSLGDLPEMRKVLNDAMHQHRIRAKHVGFWVTEFGWDTRPPEPNAVPIAIHARWIAEAMYRMWSAGVGEVTWLSLRDQALQHHLHKATVESGLYFRGRTLAQDRPKRLSLEAFRFPVYAERRGPRVHVWGRSPRGRRPVTIQLLHAGRWRVLARTTPSSYGIFELSPRAGAQRYDRVRALAGRERSVPFTLVRTRDRAVRPFG